MKYEHTSRRVGATLIDYTLFFVLEVFYIIMAGTSGLEIYWQRQGLLAKKRAFRK